MTIDLNYFEEWEFRCKCGTCDHQAKKMDTAHLRMLDNARDRAGRPFVISSGLRCVEHNAAMGGKMDSAHLTGLASDIQVTAGQQRFDILNALLSVGFHRIGIGPTWIHVDNDESKPPEVVWVY